MADALPPLTPRSAAAQSQQGGVSPRRRRARQRRQPQQKMTEGYESPRRAVRESIGVATTLASPPKSFSAMYGRRTDWTEVTGLPCGDTRSAMSVLSPRAEYSQTLSPRSSAFSIGSMSSSAVSTEQLWNQELADRRNARLSKQEAHDRKWKFKVKPYLQQQKVRETHKTNTERALERSRKEETKLEKRMEAKRLRWDKLGRKLLKDINFLFEKHKDRVNDARVGELKTDPESEETEMARKQREMHEVEKILEELKAGEITESKLHTIEDVHKAMLKDLFQSMDDDGGGVLDEQELRTLSLTLGYRLTDKELSAAMAEMDDDGSGEVDFNEFYEWWTNPKKATTLQGTAGNSFFEIVPH